jgi:hypothetical protein
VGKIEVEGLPIAVTPKIKFIAFFFILFVLAHLANVAFRAWYFSPQQLI